MIKKSFEDFNRYARQNYKVFSFYADLVCVGFLGLALIGWIGDLLLTGHIADYPLIGVVGLNMWLIYQLGPLKGGR